MRKWLIQTAGTKWHFHAQARNQTHTHRKSEVDSGWNRRSLARRVNSPRHKWVYFFPFFGGGSANSFNELCSLPRKRPKPESSPSAPWSESCFEPSMKEQHFVHIQSQRFFHLQKVNFRPRKQPVKDLHRKSDCPGPWFDPGPWRQNSFHVPQNQQEAFAQQLFCGRW